MFGPEGSHHINLACCQQCKARNLRGVTHVNGRGLRCLQTSKSGGAASEARVRQIRCIIHMNGFTVQRGAVSFAWKEKFLRCWMKHASCDRLAVFNDTQTNAPFITAQRKTSGAV